MEHGGPYSQLMVRFHSPCRDRAAHAAHLQFVGDPGGDLVREDENDPQAAAVVERADYWQRELEDVVVGMETDISGACRYRSRSLVPLRSS